jgi:hypothetical protein
MWRYVQRHPSWSCSQLQCAYLSKFVGGMLKNYPSIIIDYMYGLSRMNLHYASNKQSETNAER